MVRSERGFTLLELMVVTAIIAILAALAIPNYAVFKANGYDSTAASDARNIAPAAELIAADPNTIEEFVFLVGQGGPIAQLPGASASPGVVGVVHILPNQYEIEVEHPQGTLVYTLDSELGMSASPS